MDEKQRDLHEYAIQEAILQSIASLLRRASVKAA